MPRHVAKELHIVFDGEPGEAGGAQFVETELPDGRGVGVGTWIKRKDGLYALVINGEIPVVTDCKMSWHPQREDKCNCGDGDICSNCERRMAGPIVFSDDTERAHWAAYRAAAIPAVSSEGPMCGDDPTALADEALREERARMDDKH